MRYIKRIEVGRDLVKYSESLSVSTLKLMSAYCHICHCKVSDSSEVEHIQPPSQCESKRNDFQNLLLICGRCNKAKSGKHIELDMYIDPTQTENIKILKKIVVKFDGRLDYVSNATETEKDRINYMIKIYKLNRYSLVLRRRKTYHDTWRKIIQNLEVKKNDEFSFVSDFVQELNEKLQRR